MSLHLFNNQQEVIKRVAKKDLLVAEQTLEINVIDTLYVELPLVLWDDLEYDPEFMGVQDPKDPHSYSQYRIAETEVHVDSVVVKGVQIGFDELKANGYVKPKKFLRAPLKDVLTYVLKGSEWEASYVGDSFQRLDIELELSSRLEALRAILDTYGAEVVFKTGVTGNRIASKRIDVFGELVGFKGKRFTYGDSVLNVVKEESSAELYTALVAVGKDVVVDKYKEVPVGEQAEEAPMTITDVTWLTSAGDPVNKPRGQEYIELTDMTALYGYTETTPRIGIYENTSAETPEELIYSAYQSLLEASRPKVHFKATVGEVGPLELGETVAIIRPEIKYRYMTRVFKIVRNLIDNDVTEVEFGDTLVKTPYQRYRELASTQTKIKQELEGTIRNTADGKNRVFRGTQEPVFNVAKGDLWYKPLQNGEVEMYQFNGDQWIKAISSGINEYIANAFEESNAIIKQMRKDAFEASERIAQAIEDAKEAYEYADSAMDSANTKNTVFRGYTEPLGDVGEGDIWFRQTSETEADQLRYEGGTWVPIITSGVNTEVESGIRNAKNSADNAKFMAGKIQVEANSILAGLGVRGLENTHYDTVQGIKGAVGDRIGDIEVDLSVFTGSLNDRLDEIMDGVVDGDYDFSSFADKVYVHTNVDRAKGEITDIIAGIKTDPGLNTTWYNAMKSTMDGNVAEIGKIKETPEDVIVNYNQVVETADLFVRTLGESESEVGESVSRLVQSSDIIFSEIAKYNATPNIMGPNTRKALVTEVFYVYTQDNYIGNEPYAVTVSTSNTFVDGISFGSGVEVKRIEPLGAKGGHNHFKVVLSHLGMSNTDEIEINPHGVAGGLKDFKVEAVVQLDVTGIHSSVTQLQDSWVMSIKDGKDIVTSIMATDEGISLKGDKITLDGDTVTDNFTVTNSMLANDIDANKIITGTLNADIVTVSNLDANSITGGRLRLDRGLRVTNNDKDVLSVEYGNVTMDVNNLLINSTNIDDVISTQTYQDMESVGMLYRDPVTGEVKSIVNVDESGVTISGEHIVLNDKIVIGEDFTFDGRAIVGELTADIITVGTLDMNKIDIVNLTADSISTGKLEGVRIEADSGRIGSWDLDGGVLHSQILDGTYTTLKGTGQVALATGSPSPYSTTSASLQIWHDGTLRFGTDGESNPGRIFSNGGNLEIDSNGWIYLRPSATVFVDGRIAPWANNTGTVGTADYHWNRMFSGSYRLRNGGGIQRGSGPEDAVSSVEVHSPGSLHLKSITRNIYGQGSIYPYYSSNTYTLGSTNYRWQGVFLTSQPNVDSDTRYKDDIQDIPEGLLDNLKEIKPKMYYKDDAWHFGYIAQDVERAIYKYATSTRKWTSTEELNEYARGFAVLHKDESKLSLLYGEIAVLKDAEKDKRIESLEERLKVLEEIING